MLRSINNHPTNVPDNVRLKQKTDSNTNGKVSVIKDQMWNIYKRLYLKQDKTTALHFFIFCLMYSYRRNSKFKFFFYRRIL